MFPEEVLGLYPRRDIDFTIDIFPGEMLVSKVPDHMTTLELIEIKMEL